VIEIDRQQSNQLEPPAPIVAKVSDALTTRFLDFWLLGGASVMVWVVMSSLSAHREAFGISRHFTNVAATFATLSLAVNYPHFLAGYRLAYTRGFGFVRRHWPQTLLVPSLLIGVLAYAYRLLNDSTMPPAQGEAVLAALVNFMYLTVGWHYTKQAFGCMMVYAKLDGYPLDNLQRQSLRWSLLTFWWYSFAWNGQTYLDGSYWELKYQTWGLPRGGLELTGLVSHALIFFSVYWVIWRNWKLQQRLPSINFLIPFVAIFVWFSPYLRQMEYFLYLVPFFHSLQYLVFVYRVESHLAEPDKQQAQWTIVILGLVFCGWMGFEFVPGSLDMLMDHVRNIGVSFFLIGCSLFLNIHHYFLDNVLWRLRDDPVVRDALFTTKA
jgi:hypothetical protein